MRSTPELVAAEERNDLAVDHDLGRVEDHLLERGVLGPEHDLALAAQEGLHGRLLAGYPGDDDLAGVGAWLVGALFIPTFALALGVWSGNSKLFEILYLVIWYIGPMNHVPALDYLGSTEAGLAQGMPLVFLAVTALFAAAAVAGRNRQLQAA